MIKKMSRTDFRYVDYFFIAALFYCFFWIQQHTFLNVDLGWHLEGAKRMLAGGTFSKNIFDDNLPMVYWFFVPTLLIQSVTHFSLITLTNITIFLFTYLCFIFSHVYLKEIFVDATHKEFQLIRYTLLIILLFFPGYEFGQRDTLVTLCFIPYIFLIAARIKTHSNLQCSSIFFQSFIGFLLAIGIAMNPFYALVIIALEIQLWMSEKKIFIQRAELIIFILVYILYLLSMVVFYPDYFTDIIPSFLVFTSANNIPFYHLLLSYPTGFLIITTIVFFLSYKNSMNRYFMLTLWLSTTTAYFVFLVNQKEWPSHIVFFTTTLCFLLACTLYQTLASQKKYGVKFLVILLGSLYCLGVSTKFALLYYVYDYKSFMSPYSRENQLISFFDKEKKYSSLYTFSKMIGFTFPWIEYTTLKYLPPWPNCWVIPTIGQIDENAPAITWQQKWIRQSKKIFINQIVLDLQLKKPGYIMVDRANIKPQKKYLPSSYFDYISFLSQSHEFQKLWKNYHLITVLKNKDHNDAIYQLRN